MPEPETYDPPERERVWYRHRQTSDRGWMVRREGKPAIKYDRPAFDQYVHNVDDWEPLHEKLPDLSRAVVAQICFEADKKLCWALGHIDLAKRDWNDLHEKVRAKWIDEGPLRRSPEFEKRKKLFDAIQECLK